MKLLLPLSLLALSAAAPSTGSRALVPAGVDAAPPAARLGGAAAAPVVTAEEDIPGFRAKFREALEAKATNEMEKLVRTRKDDAVGAIMTVCVAISEGTNERLEAEIAGLRKAWKAVFKTPFADRQYETFALMSASFKRTRKDVMTAYLETYEVFEKAKADKEQGALAECADKFSSQAAALDQVGDHYQASLAWYFAAQCLDDQLRDEKADLFRACDAWEASYGSREKAGLQDEVYQWAKDRAAQLIEAGFGDPASAAAKAKEAEAAAREAAITLQTTFEVFPELDAVARPNYTIDEIYQAWPYVFLDASKRNVSALPSLPDFKGLFRRDGAAKVTVDADGDGTGEIEVPVTGNIVPVRFTTEDGREVALLTTIGRNDDTYQGFRQNLSPDTNTMSLYFAPAGSVVADLEGTPIRIFDDNMDGIYGTLGDRMTSWGHIGVREKSFQPDLDAVQVDGADKAVPFSEMLRVGERWYRMEVSEDGKELTALPLGEIPVGELALKMKGPDLDYLVVRGVGADMENVFFDLTADPRGMQVPVGTYQLFTGRVSEGKRQQTMKALILPGDSMNNFVVKEGEKTEVELGAPFGFAFDFEQDDDTVTVKDSSVVVVGKGGETYQRLWNCVPQVDVFVREVGGRKGVEIGTLRPSQSQEEMQVEGWQSAWFPKVEALEKGKHSGEEVEVQLFEKKNKLFGKIESEWTEE